MRILMLENSSAIERVVKLGLGVFPDAELKTCRSETEFAPALMSFEPEIVLVSDGFVASRDGGEPTAEQSWTDSIKDLPADRLVMLASTSSSEEALRQQGYAHVLRKPFKISEFREILQPVWLRRDATPAETAPAGPSLGGDEGLATVRARSAMTSQTSPQVTLDVGALDPGLRPARGPSRSQSTRVSAGSPAAAGLTKPVAKEGPRDATVSPQSEESQKKNLENMCARFVDEKIASQLPRLEQAAREALRAETEDRVMKVARALVRSQVEDYLNQTWSTAVKSLTGQIKSAVIQESSARISHDLGVLRDTLKTDLMASVRTECEEALRSWMGSYSRDILKEVAREELQKILGPE